MKIDFSRPLLDQADRPIENDGKPYTMLDACAGALLVQMPGEALSGEEKHKRYLLWSKIKEGGELEITVPEGDLLRKCVGQNATPLIMGQVWQFLDKS